jgi:two-component system chemotaxis sensor kinase CheA
MDRALFNKIWPVFVEEAREHLQELSSGVLQMEGPGERPEGLLEGMRRTAHSLKGSSSSLGIHDIEKLAHALEDTLVGRQNADQLDASLVEAMLAALEAMEQALKLGDEGGEPTVEDLKALLSGLAAFANRAAAKTGPANPKPRVGPPPAPEPKPLEPRPEPRPAREASALEQIRPAFETEAKEHLAQLMAAMEARRSGPFAEADAAPLLARLRALRSSAQLLAIPEMDKLAASAERELAAAARERALRPAHREPVISALAALELILSLPLPPRAPPAAAPEPPPPQGPDGAHLETLGREAREAVLFLEGAALRLGSPLSGEERTRIGEEAALRAHNLKGAAAAVGERALAEGAARVQAALGRMMEPGQAGRASAAMAEALAGLREALPPDEKRPPHAPAAPERPVAAAPDRTIRVSVGTLESVARQIESLVSLRARQERRTREIFGQVSSTQEILVLCERALSELRMAGAQGPLGALDQGVQRLRGLQRSLSRLGRESAREVEQVRLVSTVVREDVRDLRMVPAASALDPLRRTAREVAGRLKKQVELEAFGGEVRLDRRILDELKDPLQHMVRNCIDHGLESAEERRAAGKKPAGVLRLGVERRGHRIAVIVEDDGRGLDLEKIKASAVRNGVLSAQEASALSDSEAYRLIFRAGVSTAEQVTAISGRGIGMDVVQSTLTKLRGAVEVETTLGRGTRFTLDLPLTLAATLAVIVRAGGEVAALPHESVERILRLRANDLGTVAGRASVRVDELQVPFVVLSQMLGLGRGRLALDRGQAQPSLLVQAGGARVVMAVEEVIGQQEVVIQPLGRRVGAAHLAGAATLDDGRVAAVLNASVLLRLAAPMARARGADADRTRVLVADDSLTTRSTMKAVLEIAGYLVLPAADGEEALRLLRETPCPVVVTDVQMPRMDGLALTRQIKADPRLSGTKVIVVTSLDAAADRAAGLEAGADGYLVKREVERGKLLELVKQLLPEGGH